MTKNLLANALVFPSDTPGCLTAGPQKMMIRRQAFPFSVSAKCSRANPNHWRRPVAAPSVQVPLVFAIPRQCFWSFYPISPLESRSKIVNYSYKYSRFNQWKTMWHIIWKHRASGQAKSRGMCTFKHIHMAKHLWRCNNITITNMAILV